MVDCSFSCFDDSLDDSFPASSTFRSNVVYVALFTEIFLILSVVPFWFKLLGTSAACEMFTVQDTPIDYHE